MSEKISKKASSHGHVTHIYLKVSFLHIYVKVKKNKSGTQNYTDFVRL